MESRLARHNALNGTASPMFKSIRLKSRKRIYGRRDIARRLERIESTQKEISKLIANLTSAEAEMAEAETEVLKEINALRDDLRPSWIAWAQALFFFIISALLLYYGASTAVNESSVTYNVTTLHQDAQSNRTIAFEGVVAYLANLSRKQSDMPSVFNSALNQLRSADKIDAEADGFENGLSGKLLGTQILLGAGSAFFGAVVAWILTQLLAMLRWKRKEVRKPTRRE